MQLVTCVTFHLFWVKKSMRMEIYSRTGRVVPFVVCAGYEHSIILVGRRGT